MDFDLGQIVGFDWDAGNIGKNEDKHRVSDRETEQVFANTPLIIVDDVAHSGGEVRFQELGQSDANRLLFVAFTARRDGKYIRVISARDMNARERHRYAEET